MASYRNIFMISVVLIGACTMAADRPDKDWDTMANRAVSGDKLSAEEVSRCSESFNDYLEQLKARNKTTDIHGLSDAENAEHYVNAIKLAVINPEQHGGWPFRHPGRRRAYNAIWKRLEAEETTELMVAIIIPAIDNDQQQVAIAEYRKLQTTAPEWARYILTIIEKYYSKKEFVPRPAGAKRFLTEVTEPEATGQ